MTHLRTFKRFIKRTLREWLFREEEELRRRTLEIERQRLREETSYAAMMREQLRGFDPTLLTYAGDVFERGSREAENTFLSHMKEIHDDEHFHELLDYLKRNQVMHIATQAQNIGEVNFARASINGIETLREEIDRLAGLYDERMSPDDEYDAHEVV